MAGEGSRFAKEGYTFPKPLIDVRGKPMIQKVVENLDFASQYIFLVRKKHIEKYEGMIDTLHRITNNSCKIVEVEGLTEGAACTALLAREHIDCDDDLLIANSDQFIEYQRENFISLKNMTDSEIGRIKLFVVGSGELKNKHSLKKILTYIDLVCQDHEGYKMIPKSSDSVIRLAIQKAIIDYKRYDINFRIKHRQIPTRIGIYSRHSSIKIKK